LVGEACTSCSTSSLILPRSRMPFLATLRTKWANCSVPLLSLQPAR
jgi:hypothetical protein